jgi:Flavodoxin-like fold
LWWFGLPAILKGWIDRVFASGGRKYGGGKWYDRGVFFGSRRCGSLTIGGPPPIYSERGLNGQISSILFPINHGMLYFTGFTVIEPFLVHSPARIGNHERPARQCQRCATRLFRISAAKMGPNLFHQNRTVSWLMSLPRSDKRSSTLRSDSGYFTPFQAPQSTRRTVLSSLKHEPLPFFVAGP